MKGARWLLNRKWYVVIVRYRKRQLAILKYSTSEYMQERFKANRNVIEYQGVKGYLTGKRLVNRYNKRA